jgi:hypothetical protein
MMKSLEKIKRSVVELIGDFQRNPFDYLYERDLQAALFSKAYSNFQTERISMVGGYHPPENYPEDRVIRASLKIPPCHRDFWREAMALK